MYAKPELTLVGSATGVVLGEFTLEEVLDNPGSGIDDTRPKDE